jgi:hypothetical protein
MIKTAFKAPYYAAISRKSHKTKFFNMLTNELLAQIDTPADLVTSFFVSGHRVEHVDPYLQISRSELKIYNFNKLYKSKFTEIKP